MYVRYVDMIKNHVDFQFTFVNMPDDLLGLQLIKHFAILLGCDLVIIKLMYCHDFSPC